MPFVVNFRRVEPVPGRKDLAWLQLAVTQDDPDFARQCRYITLLCAQSNQISGMNNEVNEIDIASPRSFSARHYCPRCNNLSTRHVPPGATAVVKGFLHDFEASVLAGCRICFLILAAVSPYRGPGRLKAYVRPGAALNIIVKSEDKNARYDLFTEFGQTPSPWPAIGQARLIAANSAEESVLETLQSWMQDCCAHKQCLARVQATVPTRLIDVADGHVRLDSSPSPGQPYVALSHCWGSITGLPKATKSTLGLLQKEIEWEALTKTFQDAVVLTRRLGFRYIWIDSLCIVQDDEADWQKEAARMAAIYANAELVVSATSSSDGSGGLFKDRKPPQILASTDTETSSTVYEHARPPWKMSLRTSAGEAVTFLVRDTARHAQWDPFDEVARSAGAFNPLLSRAWAFQERLLATRIVHFADHELVWECRESLRCECTHLDRRGGLPMMEREQENIKLELARALARPIAQPSPLEVLRLWARIVEAYTDRGLTFEKDRLLALSGVADQLVRHGLQNYAAGLFLEDIPHSLLWHVEEPGMHHQAQIAPTWSWASVAKPAQRPPRVKFDWLSARGRLAASCVEAIYTFHLAGLGKDRGVALGLIAPLLTCTLQMRKVDHTPMDSFAFMHFDLQGSGFVYSVCCGGRSTPFSPDILLHQGAGKLEPGQQVHVLVLGRRADKAKPDCALVLRRLRVGELPEYTGVVDRDFPDVLKGGDVFIRIGLIRGLEEDRSDFLDGARKEFVIVL